MPTRPSAVSIAGSERCPPDLWNRVSEVRGTLFDPAADALTRLVAVTLGALVVGSLVIRRRQYPAGS